jgi:hypothetical protein
MIRATVSTETKRFTIHLLSSIASTEEEVWDRGSERGSTARLIAGNRKVDFFVNRSVDKSKAKVIVKKSVLRACLVKMRVTPFRALAYAEELSNSSL